MQKPEEIASALRRIDTVFEMIFREKCEPNEANNGSETVIPESAEAENRRIYAVLSYDLFRTHGKTKAALAWRHRHAFEAHLVPSIDGVTSFSRWIALSSNVMKKSEDETRVMINCALDAARLRIAKMYEEASGRDSGAVHADASRDITRGAKSEQDERTAGLFQTIADLLAVVAEQQQQIEALRLAVEAAAVARVQVQVTQLAQEDFRQRIADVKEILPEMARTGGEFSVGKIEHRGTLTIRRSTSATTSDKIDSSASSQSAKKADIAAEIKGLASKIAGFKGSVAVDVSRLGQRVESLCAERREYEDTKIEGTFETHQTGSTFRFEK